MRYHYETLPEPPRYQQPLYLGDLAARRYWAERKPTIEIEIIREGNRVKRRGILNRANGTTIFVGVFCYSMTEIISYRRVIE